RLRADGAQLEVADAQPRLLPHLAGDRLFGSLAGLDLPSRRRPVHREGFLPPPKEEEAAVLAEVAEGAVPLLFLLDERGRVEVVANLGEVLPHSLHATFPPAGAA